MTAVTDTALLIIGTQRDFCSPRGRAERAGIGVADLRHLSLVVGALHGPARKRCVGR